MRENRLRSEALLVTVDVVVFVVSRHTYQNAALVDVVQQAVGRGRPWVVVYNEAPELQTVRAHLDKLAADVGAAPFARYRSPHDPEVEMGRRRLSVEPVDGGPGLAELLEDPERGAALRTRARAAALRDAAAELRELELQVLALASEPERLRTRLRHGLAEVGARAALRAVPADVLLEAFRDELDARSPVNRWIPPSVPGARGGAGGGRAQAPGARSARRTPRRSRRRRPRRPMRRCATASGSWWSRWARSSPPWRGDAATRDALAAALGLPTLSALQAPGPLVEDASLREDRAQLLARCRELVRAHLPGGFEEGAIQALATLVYSVPASAAAVVTVATGGIGHDAVVWVGTLLTTPLMERFVDLLGTGVRGEVVRSLVRAAWRLARAGAGGEALRASAPAARRPGRGRRVRRGRVLPGRRAARGRRRMRWFRRARQDEAPPPPLPEPELIRSRLLLACECRR